MTSAHLFKKPINILITNICNLSCGGCSQQCGYIPKEKIWNIPLEQLKWNLDLLVDVRKNKLNMVGIFGGEPTLHPEYKKILDLISNYKRTTFVIFTNGRDFDKINYKKVQSHLNDYSLKDYSNIIWKIDFKDKNSIYGGIGQTFLPTQVAAMDILKIKNKNFYWEKAQKQCVMWDRCWCIIYNNKAYFCEIAASFDMMNNESSYGWPLVWGVDPFLRTEEEIAKQANNFCYRCGWCLTQEELIKADVPMQKVKDPTIVSHINMKTKMTKKPIVKIKNNIPIF
jgi:organic radical activating enzyme